MRIVSLLPSATEIVAALGAADRLVGRSHECDWPGGLGGLPVLTDQRTDAPDPAGVVRQVRDALASHASLYTLDEARLRELRPDLIVTQDLCDVCSIDLAAVRRAAATIDPEPEVVSLNPTTFEGVLDDVLTVGGAIGEADRAQDLVVELRARMTRAMDFVNPYDARPRILYMEWVDPVFVGGHWIPQLIERAGAEHPLNPCAPRPGSGAALGPMGAEMIAGKSVTATPEQILAVEHDGGRGKGWDRVSVGPCGVTLDEAEAQARALLDDPVGWLGKIDAVRTGRVAIVDGNQMFSRPGPRLVNAFEWLVGWVQERPALIPNGFPWKQLAPQNA